LAKNPDFTHLQQGPSSRAFQHRRDTVKRTRIQIVAGVVIALIILFVLWAKGSRDTVLVGTFQWGFEESAFFRDGDCSKKPFWWEYPNQLDKEVGAKWEALGKPPALRLVVRGNLSAFGLHGHLGAYRREVQPIALVSVAPASRCQWTWVKDGR
jgi:hypothetical protein